MSLVEIMARGLGGHARALKRSDDRKPARLDREAQRRWEAHDLAVQRDRHLARVRLHRQLGGVAERGEVPLRVGATDQRAQREADQRPPPLRSDREDGEQSVVQRLPLAEPTGVERETRMQSRRNGSSRMR